MESRDPLLLNFKDGPREKSISPSRYNIDNRVIQDPLSFHQSIIDRFECIPAALRVKQDD